MNKKRVTSYISPDNKTKIIKLASDNKRTESQMIEVIIDQYLKTCDHVWASFPSISNGNRCNGMTDYFIKCEKCGCKP